jgi:hypothetical protein
VERAIVLQWKASRLQSAACLGSSLRIHQCAKAGGAAFETNLNFRVTAPSQFEACEKTRRHGCQRITFLDWATDNAAEFQA